MLRSIFHLFLVMDVIAALNLTTGCWPGNIVPFRIPHGFNESQIYMIQEVIKEFNELTCIRWVDGDKVPYNTSRNEVVVFLKVDVETFCDTSVSKLMNGGEVINVQLGDNCFEKSMLIHQMMHVLGFSHEHQRADRDCYVQIVPDVSGPFSPKDIDIKHEPWLESFPYDKQSNTHFPRSILIQPAIKKYNVLSYNSPDEPFGNESGELSFLDLWKILYKFCGFAHYCDVFPQICVFMEEAEKGCIKKETQNRQYEKAK